MMMSSNFYYFGCLFKFHKSRRHSSNWNLAKFHCIVEILHQNDDTINFDWIQQIYPKLNRYLNQCLKLHLHLRESHVVEFYVVTWEWPETHLYCFSSQS